MWKLVNTAGMSVIYIAAIMSVVLLFLQLIRKVSLSHPVLVYAGIVAFPPWCLYSCFHLFLCVKTVLDSYENAPGSLQTALGKVSGATVVNLLWALFISSVPYLLFLIGYIKVNLFPYRSVHKELPEKRESTARMTCLRLCRYALFMQAVYLSIITYILMISLEPIVLGLSMLSMSLPWGIAGTLIAIMIVPPLGLVAGLVVTGLGAITFLMLMTPLLFVSLLLTVALIPTCNAVIRTCRYVKLKALWLTILAIFPGCNLCILIYLMIRLSKKSIPSHHSSESLPHT